MHGGRLGTCLIEQYAIGLDELGGALARQHDMPVALQRHFDQADPVVQQRLAPETAAQWLAVPLGRLPGEVERIAVAVLEPLSDDALYELGDALGAQVVAAVAPQLRILYHLERVYGIERPNRFKRGQAREGSDPGSERRGFVRTLSDADPLTDATTGSLGRIAVRRIQVAPTASAVVEPEPEVAQLDGALRAIRRASGRARVGSLVVSALEQGFGGALSAGMILTIRAGLLLGWRGFVRGRPSGPSMRQSIEAVAVPLGVPSLFAEPCRCAVSYFGGPSAGNEVDQRLWTLLGTAAPGEIGVHPVHVFGQLSCVLYVQTEGELPPAVAGGVAELGQSLCAALERLVRADER